jgi:hypothetical protein
MEIQCNINQQYHGLLICFKCFILYNEILVVDSGSYWVTHGLMMRKWDIQCGTVPGNQTWQAGISPC